MFDVESIKDIEREQPKCPKDIPEYINKLFPVDYLVTKANDDQSLDFRFGYMRGVREVLGVLRKLANVESED